MIAGRDLDRPPAAALDLAGIVRSGNTVIWGQACAEPLTLTRALTEQQPRIGTVQCFLGIGADAGSPTTGLDALAYGGGGTTRRLDAAGALDVVPARYSDLPGLFVNRTVPIDVALVQATEGATPGTYHFALAAEYLVAAAESARAVVVEVNRGAPHLPDAPLVPTERIAAVVAADHPPAELAGAEPSAVDQRIALYVATLVPDGATLQIGIGTLPEAIVRGLAGHRDLGVHSGAIGDAVADLIEAGTITNAGKSDDAGHTTCGVLLGSHRLFAFADGNPGLRLRDTRYTHDPARLARQHRLVAINAAVEVDLTGQVNSEVAAGRYIGAAGGTLDFARGAYLSPGGVPIIALRSTAGARSTIVAALAGPVTVPRSEPVVVVTEYGIADLRGLPLARRRSALIAIAHPDHRDALAGAARGPGERRPIITRPHPTTSSTTHETGAPR